LRFFVLCGLAYGLVFLPHRGYAYPLHVDEWFHLSHFRAVQETGTLGASVVPLYEFPDFTSGAIDTRRGDVEPAFHVFWAVFQDVTRIPWLTIFRYFPGFVFLPTILAVYALAREEGFGWEAAFLAVLIPTSVTVLGPSFLVPVALGLMFLPLSLMLLRHEGAGSYCVLSVFTTFLVFMHLPTAVVLALVLLPFLVLRATEEPKQGLMAMLPIVTPLLAFAPLIVGIAPGFALKTFTQPIDLPPYLPYVPRFWELWGYLPTALFIVGTVLLMIRGQRENRALVFASFILLFMNFVFVAWHRGVQTLYHRIPLYSMMLMSIIGGYALWNLRTFSFGRQLLSKFEGSRGHLSNLGLALLIVVLGLALGEKLVLQARTPLYRMIDLADYEAFTWVERNVPACYHKAILDPWKATAFMALARREVYARIQHATGQDERNAYKFLNENSGDTSFLRSNGISIVYSRAPVLNGDLRRVRDHVYLVPDVACDELFSTALESVGLKAERTNVGVLARQGQAKGAREQSQDMGQGDLTRPVNNVWIGTRS
jgi:hypothetical protein